MMPLGLLFLRSICAFVLAAMMIAPQARAETRIAMVIGNGDYQMVSSLDNPVGDATLMAKTLEQKGFKVNLLLNASQSDMNRAIAQFGRDLREGGSDATGLFYYAGHGVQSFGSNYLLPVDASLTVAADLGLVAIPAETVLRQMSSARNKTNIVILDACRNNPFETVPDMNDNGLAEMKAPTGTFLAYATAPGAVAYDGMDANSPFTRALANEIDKPGVPIEQTFKQTRVAVISKTGGAQTPWDTSSLTATFYFSPPTPMSAAEVEAKQLWDSVRQTRDPVQIMLFLRGYADSSFAPEARELLGEVMAEELNTAAPAQTAPAPVVLAEPETATATTEPEAREKELIEVARTSGLAVDYEAYLAEFPAGTYSELAKFELTMLAAKKNEPAVVATATAPAPEPEPSLNEPASMMFDTPLINGADGVKGKSIAELIKGSPMFPPIEGIPESMWKGQTCSNCHNWTRSALCDQGKTYLAQNGARALDKNHPLGGPFKRALRVWASGDCK